ncbi:hypothetical protein PSHI_09460 [Pseudomonas sp. URMO17WK12:I11]|nr:hypothetical protein PSHI_09460 [Pseudomonas sp. URMO17WK12:I11]
MHLQKAGIKNGDPWVAAFFKTKNYDIKLPD